MFLLVQACLGIEIDALDRRVSIRRGRLPAFVDQLRVSDLRIGDAEIDLQFDRHTDGLGVRVLRRHGNVDVHVKK